MPRGPLLFSGHAAKLLPALFATAGMNDPPPKKFLALVFNINISRISRIYRKYPRIL